MTVVTAIIADADAHVMRAERLVAEILGGIPPRYRDGFVFHAADLFNPTQAKEDWSPTDRLRMLKAMMAVPRRLGMALCVSCEWRGSVDYSELRRATGMSGSQCDHYMAFWRCLAVADRNIREHAGADEVAVVVAEDHEEMRQFLRDIPSMGASVHIHTAPQHLIRTLRDEEAGYLTQSGEMRIVRIRNPVNFVKKDEDPLVQVADACAFGFRRYFAGEKMGEELADAIIGDHNLIAHFSAPRGTECFWPRY